MILALELYVHQHRFCNFLSFSLDDSLTVESTSIDSLFADKKPRLVNLGRCLFKECKKARIFHESASLSNVLTPRSRESHTDSSLIQTLSKQGLAMTGMDVAAPRYPQYPLSSHHNQFMSVDVNKRYIKIWI